MLGVYLFGNPSWELSLKKPLDPFQFFAKGEDLNKRLKSIGVIVSKLQNNGWELIQPCSCPYVLYFWKPGMTKKRIVDELKVIKINIGCVEVLE
ncbi:hypothetical protein HY486_04625 [Candidatus Woesearchaeota archaeon]|nr:hypothetical protein [Candidatus Woesearchaeota archaeon]